jgi:hypothetical protein
MEQHFCCVQARFLDMETKIFFPCYGIFSTGNNVFEALDLILKKVCNRLETGDFHHIIIYITNAAAVHSSLQLCISAQAVGMASPFKLPSQVENTLPCSFPQANLGKMAISAVL